MLSVECTRYTKQFVIIWCPELVERFVATSVVNNVKLATNPSTSSGHEFYFVLIRAIRGSNFPKRKSPSKNLHVLYKILRHDILHTKKGSS